MSNVSMKESVLLTVSTVLKVLVQTACSKIMSNLYMKKSSSDLSPVTAAKRVSVGQVGSKLMLEESMKKFVHSCVTTVKRVLAQEVISKHMLEVSMKKFVLSNVSTVERVLARVVIL